MVKAVDNMQQSFFNVYFVRGASPLAKLIRLFDKGEFSHVAIGLPDKNHVIDAQYPLGVRIRHFRFKDYEVVNVPLDIDKAYKLIGYKYDWKLFFYFAFRVGKPWNTPNQYLCSELVAFAMGRDDLLELTPNELYRELLDERDK